MNLFKSKRTIVCDKCGGKMVEQVNANVISGDGIKRRLYKCKKCKQEKIQ